MSTNTDLASMFHTMATILEIKGESGFKVNANTKVARALEDLVEDVASIPDLTSIPGVGKSSATKIQNYLKTGQMIEFEALRNSIPSGLLDVMRVQGLGPKKVRQLWQEADVIDIATLRKAIDDGRLDTLPRMGKKTIENISEALAFVETSGNRTRIGIAMPLFARLRCRRACQLKVRLRSIKSHTLSAQPERSKTLKGHSGSHLICPYGNKGRIELYGKN